MTTTAPTANTLHHQVGQHVEYWGYLRSELLHRGVVLGWCWTQDDDGANSIGDPYKVYLVDVGSGDPRRLVHDSTYVDHDATRGAIAAWRAAEAASRPTAEDTMTTPNYPTARLALRAEITSDSGGDPYQWAVGRWFDVLGLMSLAGIPIPDECGYDPAGLDWDEFAESASADLLRIAWEFAANTYGGREADETLTYWARVLTRYLRLPAVAALAD